MDEGTGCGNVSVSLPSLRVDAFTVGVAAQIQRARRTGLTFAPEAGTWRMRQVINKLITEEDLYAAVDSAFSQGWKRVKLYFLTGLPTETDEDTLGIVELARRCVELAKAKGHNGSVTVSVGGFVPKAFTPFQWFGMNTEEELRRKVGLLRDAAKGARGVQLKWHDPKASLIEGLVSRGDRRLGPVIEHVWRAGGTFQEWSEHFRLDLWQEAMAAHGLDLDWYCHRHRTEDEVLPWDHLSAGLHKDFLWQDWRDALEELGLEDCRWTPCYDCGACTGYGIEHVVASAVPPAGGSQGTGQGLPLRRAGRAVAPQAGGGGRVRARAALHQARQAPLPVPPRPRPDLGAEPAPGRRAVAYSEGFSPRPAALRAGPVHRAREPRRVPRHRPGARRRASTPADLPGVVDRRPARRASTAQVGGARRAGHTIAPAGGHQLHAGSSRSSAPSRRGGRGRGRPGPGRRRAAHPWWSARAAEVDLDARPAIVALELAGPLGPAARVAVIRPSTVLVAELATQPRSLRPAELVRALDPTWVEGRVLRTHQWTLVDGARREPIPLPEGGARGARSTPHAGARAS